MKTLVIGASTNSARYSYKATKSLLEHGHEVALYGLKKGDVYGVSIEQTFPNSDIDTVTMYVGPQNQPSIYQDIIDLKPRRVIFNPGTENTEFIKMLQAEGIETEDACTLVLLSLKSY
ncbi:CoA-binding protein [Cyclobacteriaceae bacterium]|nr:CoA-binding protein [Cyclobacteriaceae bacterium]